MRSLILVMLAACYSPAPYAGCDVRCQLDSDCPTGLSCSGNRCSERAKPCTGPDALDPDADEDGDLIPNGKDLCIGLSSPDNRDHDKDGRGDPCDPCPFSIENTDTDEDGVGNACDPRPNEAGDRASAFYGFYDASEYAMWMPAGMWQVANGGAVGTNAGVMGGLFHAPGMFGENIAIYASLTITELDATTVPGYVGIAARRVGAYYQACELAVLGAVQEVRMRKYDGSLPDVTKQYRGPVLGKHELVLLLAGSNGTCTIDGETASRTDAPAAAGTIALEATNANVAFDFLFVVRSP